VVFSNQCTASRSLLSPPQIFFDIPFLGIAKLETASGCCGKPSRGQTLPPAAVAKHALFSHLFRQTSISLAIFSVSSRLRLLHLTLRCRPCARASPPSLSPFNPFCCFFCSPLRPPAGAWATALNLPTLSALFRCTHIQFHQTKISTPPPPPPVTRATCAHTPPVITKLGSRWRPCLSCRREKIAKLLSRSSCATCTTLRLLFVAISGCCNRLHCTPHSPALQCTYGFVEQLCYRFMVSYTYSMSPT
jgi:hypothetical protein